MTRFITSFEEFAREEERQAIVLRQLNRKVGPIPVALHARVASLTPDAMLALSEALLDFSSQQELLRWLASIDDSA